MLCQIVERGNELTASQITRRSENDHHTGIARTSYAFPVSCWYRICFRHSSLHGQRCGSAALSLRVHRTRVRHIRVWYFRTAKMLLMFTLLDVSAELLPH